MRRCFFWFGLFFWGGCLFSWGGAPLVLGGVLGRQEVVQPKLVVHSVSESGRLLGECWSASGFSRVGGALGGVLQVCFSGEGRSRAWVFELRGSGETPGPFWLDVGISSSMGEVSFKRLGRWGEGFVSDLMGLEGSGVPLSWRPSLVSGVLGGMDAVTLPRGAGALSELISSLVGGDGLGVSVDRGYWAFWRPLDSFSWVQGGMFVVDPFPSSGPDTHSYLVVWASWGQE